MNRTNGRVTKAWPRMLVGILVFMVALGTSVGMAQTRMSYKDDSQDTAGEGCEGSG